VFFKEKLQFIVHKKFDKMKIISGILLVVFASLGESVIINCNFQEHLWAFNTPVYACWSSTENTGNLLIIEGVRGTHSTNRSNADVNGFREEGNKLQYIPTNLGNVFPNLKAIFIVAPLLQLSASDLKPFPNLVMTYIHRFKFTSIESDLFQYTKKLRLIRLSFGSLKNVGENILSGLSELTEGYFNDNTCINYEASTPQMMATLKQKLLTQCPPLNPSTTSRPTTTLSTTTTAKCPVRCTLDTDFDNNVARQDNVNTKLREKDNELMKIITNHDEEIIQFNKKFVLQENRFNELEMKIRKIELRT
jgi:hypothetical protein